MLRDIIETAISAQDDMQLVGWLDDVGGDAMSAKSISEMIHAASASGAPDVVVVDRVDERSIPLLDEVLFDHPRLAVLAVTRDGRCAHMRMLRPLDEVVDRVSPTGLIAAIRRSRRPEMTR
jgi:hypothetical protein